MMAVVGLVSVVFTRLGWPKVIGYLLAGILMSEHTWGGSFLADPKSIGTIGQLGIVFLMFTLGLEFSADDMKQVKHVTVPTAIFDTLMMIWFGYTVGTHMLGGVAWRASFSERRCATPPPRSSRRQSRRCAGATARSCATSSAPRSSRTSSAWA